MLNQKPSDLGIGDLSKKQSQDFRDLVLPLSTSSFLTQSFKVCAEQPIFADIDMIAYQRVPCWASFSSTSVTARSRTSG